MVLIIEQMVIDQALDFNYSISSIIDFPVCHTWSITYTMIAIIQPIEIMFSLVIDPQLIIRHN